MHLRFLYIVAVGLAFMGCTEKPNTSEVNPSTTSLIPIAPAPIAPAPIAPIPFNIDALVKQYGEPVQLGGEKSDRYVLVKVSYDSNDDLQGQPEEPALANWKVTVSGSRAQNRTDSTWFSSIGTTNSSGGFLLQLPIGLNRDLLFTLEQPNASEGLVTWNALDLSVLANPNTHVQEVFLTAGCRAAETGLVVPYPKATSEVSNWPCRREPRQTQSVSGTWETLGDGILSGSTSTPGDPRGTSALIEAFRMAPDGSPLLAITTPFSDVNYSITRFWKWQDTWISALREVTGGDNSVLPTVHIDPSGQFLKSTWIEKTRSYTIETAKAQSWKNPIPLGPVFGYQKFNLDPQGRPIRRERTGSSSSFSTWNGSEWIALPSHSDPLASIDVTTYGQVFAESAQGFDLFQNNAWVHVSDVLKFPPRLSKQSCRLAANTSTNLLLDCTVQFRPTSEIPETKGFSARALYLYHQGVWQPLLFERNLTVLENGFDSQGRAVIVVIDGNKLFVDRWNIDHWEHVGPALNDSGSIMPGGNIKFATGPDGSLSVAWVGVKTPARNVYVSQLKE
jgi:hypothetical protein